MGETKIMVRELLDRLPDDCSLDDVLYHLYVVQRVEQGLADADAGRAYEMLALAAVDGVLATLDAIGDGSVAWREQAGEATFAQKIGPDDRRIDWSRSAKASSTCASATRRLRWSTGVSRATSWRQRR